MKQNRSNLADILKTIHLCIGLRSSKVFHPSGQADLYGTRAGRSPVMVKAPNLQALKGRSIITSGKARLNSIRSECLICRPLRAGLRSATCAIGRCPNLGCAAFFWAYSFYDLGRDSTHWSTQMELSSNLI